VRISRKISLCATAAALVLETLTASAEEAVLRIAKQGSMEAGGKSINCATNDGGDANSTRRPSGHVVIDQVYASFQYPADRRYPYPILFNSGGGHTARVYDTTPDGREGWLTLFLREGFPVYGVDRPNTGRSGTDICKINAVKLGKAPIGELPAISRYAAESSWVTFRCGPKFGEPYPNTQFPIAAADNYYPQTVSTYRDPEETQKSVAAFAALIDKIPEPGACQEKEHPMPRASTVHAVIAIGIDLGKSTLHMTRFVWRHRAAREGLARTHRLEACEPATLPHWHRSRNGDTLCCS
jgi:pimeloyl-ACP methyl ester carboxylesterase